MATKFKDNSEEIKYNLINSALAGALVFVGSFTGAGFQVTPNGICAAFFASVLVALTKFKEYWDGEAREYSTKIFNFI